MSGYEGASCHSMLATPVPISTLKIGNIGFGALGVGRMGLDESLLFDKWTLPICPPPGTP